MMKARVDRSMCMGSAMCVDIAPEAFELDDEGLSHATGSGTQDEAQLREAAETCPAQAIELMDDDGKRVYP
jgi:ferredoxin